MKEMKRITSPPTDHRVATIGRRQARRSSGGNSPPGPCIAHKKSKLGRDLGQNGGGNIRMLYSMHYRRRTLLIFADVGPLVLASDRSLLPQRFSMSRNQPNFAAGRRTRPRYPNVFRRTNFVPRTQMFCRNRSRPGDGRPWVEGWRIKSTFSGKVEMPVFRLSV
jgi:hypothetical protein